MKIKFGKVKVYAHRFMNGEPIPVFENRQLNKMIDGHCNRIERAKTSRKKNEK